MSYEYWAAVAVTEQRRGPPAQATPPPPLDLLHHSSSSCCRAKTRGGSDDGLRAAPDPAPWARPAPMQTVTDQYGRSALQIRCALHTPRPELDGMSAFAGGPKSVAAPGHNGSLDRAAVRRAALWEHPAFGGGGQAGDSQGQQRQRGRWPQQGSGGGNTPHASCGQVAAVAHELSRVKKREMDIITFITPAFRDECVFFSPWKKYNIHNSSKSIIQKWDTAPTIPKKNIIKK